MIMLVSSQIKEGGYKEGFEYSVKYCRIKQLKALTTHYDYSIFRTQC